MKIVLVDQLCFAPVALTSFYVGLSALELKSVEEIKEEWKSKFPKTWAVRQNINTVWLKKQLILLISSPLLQTGVLYWPFVQAANFAFVPAKNRAVVVGVMSFFWTVGLSFFKNQEHSKNCDKE